MDFLIPQSASEDCPFVPPQQSYLAEYVLYPFYDMIVLYYPVSWTPNKVTLFGIVATLLSSVLFFTGMPPSTLFEPPYGALIPASLLLDENSKWLNSPASTPLHPSVLKPPASFIFPSANWMLFACGILNLIYCVADNTDGRFARRLKKASSIGEYLDHGLDCVSSLLSTSVGMCVLGLSLSNVALTVMIVAMGTVLSHTLHYEKHIFIWGNRFISVDEAMLFFCVVNWVPIVLPQLASARVSPSILSALLPKVWADALTPLRYVEVIMMVYLFFQVYVIIGIAFRNWRMLFRLPSLLLAFNAALHLGLIPHHTEHIMAAGPVGYAWGPLSYVAVWCITVACTSSTIVHVIIYAHCCRLPRVDPWGLAGLFFVWPTFVGCPVAAMVMSAGWHVVQILCYVRDLQRSSHRRFTKTKTMRQDRHNSDG